MRVLFATELAACITRALFGLPNIGCGHIKQFVVHASTLLCADRDGQGRCEPIR